MPVPNLVMIHQKSNGVGGVEFALGLTPSWSMREALGLLIRRQKGIETDLCVVSTSAG